MKQTEKDDNQIGILIRARNEAICRLWSAFRDLSDKLQPDEWSKADLDLWKLVTRHDAVQTRLDNALGKREAATVSSAPYSSTISYDWTCACGIQHKPDVERCYGCSRDRPNVIPSK